MSINNGNEPAAPVFMTCGELIHQEDRYIREYAAHYDIPTDLSRGEMLERICALHPGAEPTITILPHFSFERARDGRIRITGHTELAGPSTQPPGPSSQALHPHPRSYGLPARPLVREHAQIITLQERSTPESDHQAVIVPEEHVPPIEGHASPTEEEPSPIIPEELYPTRRFPTPSDTYSSCPSREPSPAPHSPRSDVFDVPPPKPRMEFVYPPRPRPHARSLQSDGEAAEDEDDAREFSPGPPWLEKMIVDLQRGRKELVKSLGETKRDAQDALYDLITARALMDREQVAFQACVEKLRCVLGDKLVNTLIAEGTQAAEERTSDEEEEEEAEDGEQERDSEKHGDEDEDGDDGDERPPRRPLLYPTPVTDNPVAYSEPSPSKKRDSDNAETKNGAKGSMLNVFQSQLRAVLLDGPVSPQPRKRTFTTFSDDEADEREDADDETSPSRPVAGPSRKRSRMSPSPPESRRTSQPSSPISVPPIATLMDSIPPSPSRKRGRADDDEESEREVERSIRVSTSLERSCQSLLTYGNKRFRSDIAATSPEARDAASIWSPKLALVPHVPAEHSTSGPGGLADTSDKDGTPFVLWNCAPEEDDDDESYLPSDDDEDYDTLESDVTEDETIADDDGMSNDWDSDGGHSNSVVKSKQNLYAIDDKGTGSWTWDAPSSLGLENRLDVGFQGDLEPLGSGSPRSPDGSPNRGRLLGINRPLVRTRERLRPTPGGGVEAYKFDEGPEYEARLAREAEAAAEWRKFGPQPSGHRTRESLREMKKIEGRPLVGEEEGGEA